MTNKKIARTPKSRKRPTKTPTPQGRTLGEVFTEHLAKRGVKVPPPKTDAPLPAGLVERAAERAGVTPSAAKQEAPEVQGLTPEDEAALVGLQDVSGRRSPVVEGVLKAYRKARVGNDEVRVALRREAHDLEYLAERLRPEPATRDAMLVDALEVIERALTTFESAGSGKDTALGIALEGLRCAAAEFDLFMDASSAPCTLDSMAFLRASERAKLALSLAAFRAKHPEWKPAKADETDEGDETEGSEPARVAS